MKGCCERGVTCTYAHGEDQIGEEIVAAPLATCKWWMQGTCRLGSRCKYAHFSTAAEGELVGNLVDQEVSKLMAKDVLAPKYESKSEKKNKTQQWKKNSQQSVSIAESRISNGSTASHGSQASTLSLDAMIFQPQQPQQEVAQFHKPQTATERQELMALLGNVMAALQ